MKITFTIKQFVLLTGALLFACFLVSNMIVLLTIIAKSDHDLVRVLVPAIGSIAGGVIGGIVAFIIAAYNAKTASEKEECKQLKTSCAMLRLIKEELLDNATTLSSVIPFSNEGDRLLKVHLTDDTWKTTMTKIILEEKSLSKLNICYKKINLLKALEAKDIGDDSIIRTKEQILNMVNIIDTEINSCENELK